MADTEEIKMIVGLGNPGKEYAGTRHNAGFEVVDLVSGRLGIEVKKKKFGSLFGECVYRDKKLILLKPQLYMNLSGQAVATAMGFYKVGIRELLVICDDMALPVGAVRIRRQGSGGGQKGLGDIVSKLGTEEFSRLRIGIGSNERIDAVDYVLGRPGGDERALLEEGIGRGCEAVMCWIEKGIEAAMNEFNRGAGGEKEQVESK